MKNTLVFSILIAILSGCSSSQNKQKTQSNEIGKPYVLAKPGSVTMMSVTNAFAYDAKDICIDVSESGEIVVTFTEANTGNRCSVWGNVEVVNLSEGDWKIRDYSKGQK